MGAVDVKPRVEKVSGASAAGRALAPPMWRTSRSMRLGTVDAQVSSTARASRRRFLDPHGDTQSLRTKGLCRNWAAAGLITRRSRVQIPPPLLQKAPETAPFVSDSSASLAFCVRVELRRRRCSMHLASVAQAPGSGRRAAIVDGWEFA
jgi:hypothetical protein